MERKLFAVLCAAAFVIASAGAASATGNGRAAQWRAFFAQVLPLVPKDFVPIKGAYLPQDDVYASKLHFDPKLVANCHIFTTGAQPQWHMRCDSLGYDSLTSLVADLGAALPTFTKGANMMGQPQWSDKQRQTFVTVVALGGVLITHGDPDAY